MVKINIIITTLQHYTTQKYAMKEI